MKFFMFPGQGSQFAGMGKTWASQFKEAALAFEEASDGCALNLKKLCFDGTDYDLKQTEVTQPAILTTSIAIFRSLKAHGPLQNQEALFAGHSLGEYSALVASGALELNEAAKLVRHRGQYMQEAVPVGRGAMAALVFKPGTEGSSIAKRLCDEASAQSRKLVSVANFNSPEQIVISGEVEAVEALKVLAAKPESGVRKTVPLETSAPFHCSLMQPAAQRLAPELFEAKFKSVSSSYVPNISATLEPLSDSKLVAKRLVEQITGSVRWTDSVRTALKAGCREAIEFGPGAVLCGLAKRISIEADGQAVSLEARATPSWEGFL